MQYKYCLFNYTDDYLLPLVNGHEAVLFERDVLSKHPFLRQMLKLHWSKKMNQSINLPHKKKWFPLMFGRMAKNSSPCCYVFYRAQYVQQETEIIRYIKNLNADNKVVLVFGDLVSKRKSGNLQELFQQVDLVLSYDPAECEKYGMTYLQSLYYSPLLPVTTPETFDYDVFFLGYAKDRLDTIHAVWRRLSEQGVRCHFMIAGTKPEQRLQGEGLHYIEKPISYRESLEYIQRSRCIMELIQGKSVATTMRALEAVCYKRKLISNCPVLKESQLYSEENMLVFDDPTEITATFAQAPVDYVAYETVHTLTPDDYIAKIEALLEEKEHGKA